MNRLEKFSYPTPFIQSAFKAEKQRPTSVRLRIFLFLSAVALFKPIHFLSASDAPQESHVPNQIIVQYKDPSFSPLATNPEASNQQSSFVVSPPYKYSAILPGRIDLVLIEGENIDQLLEALKNDPNVEYAEPHTVKQLQTISFERSDLPNDSDFDKQWALNNSTSTASGSDIDFLEAHALSRESSPDNPVIIGIIDSTFAIEHPDLKNQLWVNHEEIPNNGIDDDNNGYIDDIHGFDFVNLSPNVLGEDDHGSHVAGICAAEKNNQEGISGAFPNVQFIPLACSSGGRGISSIAILRAKAYLNDLKNREVNIVAVNASYGGSTYSQAEFDAISDLSNNGILMCTASGNDGWNLDLEKDLNENGQLDAGEDLNGNGFLEVSYPNSYDLPNIISVASINSNQELSPNSNYGSTEVDLAAPGVSIYSTVSLAFSQETQNILLSNGTSIANQLIENASGISGDSLSGQLVYCGIGEIDEFPPEVNGNIALIQRGTLYFSDKVINAMNAGAIATIIYNNVAEDPDGLRPWLLDGIPNVPWIPSFSISQADGQSLLQALPLTATLKPFINIIDPNSNPYAYLSGTSMAAPVVTAAVAFAAHNFPHETMTQRRARILDNAATLPSLANKVATGGVVNLRKIVDTDQDNLPDWWEMDHFNTLSHNNSQDNDNDGYTNREEFLSKTKPTLVSDTPRITIDDLQITDDSLEFNFITYPGYLYTIEKSDALDSSWTSQATYTGDGTPIKATIKDYKPTGKTKGFYRLEANHP